MTYDPHDPYTLIFLGNIYYSLATQIRSKGIDSNKLNKAIVVTNNYFTKGDVILVHFNLNFVFFCNSSQSHAGCV